MTSLAINDTSLIVVKNFHVDHYDFQEHTIITIPQSLKPHEQDAVSDIALSTDGRYLAIITSVSKRLLVYELPLCDKFKSFVLPRSASKIRFAVNDQQIFVADKSGDVLLYDISSEETGTKLLGHLSLLLDVLQSSDGNYIVTSDRDEKIRVSCYPNTYNIQTYCLGHKEFVNHIELLPHSEQYLMSTSGDGYVKCWDFVAGKLCYSINTYVDVNDEDLKNEFSKAMDSEGVAVDTLPIVHYSHTKLDDCSSILAVVVHNFNKVLLYKFKTVNNDFSHELIDKLTVERYPTAIKFHKSSLYLYDAMDNQVSIYNIVKENNSVSLSKKLKMFENTDFTETSKEFNQELIKVLYKRRFDNVQEYQERKRQRLEKSK